MARVDVAVTGLFIEPRSGDPASGVIRFALPQPIVSPLDGFTIEPVEVEAVLDLTGRVDIVLSTVSGVNAVYVATVSITGADPRRFEFVVPASGDPIDLAAVQPIIPVLTDVPAQTTDSGPFLRPAANLSDVASAGTARTNLGLGSAATQPTSAFDAAGAATTAQTAERTRALAAEAVIVTSVTTEATRATAAEAALASSIAGSTVSDATATSKGIVQLAGDLAGTADAPTVPGLAAKADASALAAEASRAATAENQALRKTSNLSDLTNTATARSNLGLGSAATQAASAFDAAGSASAAQAASQPVDSDLTAIAALSTTSFGRSLLALADAAAGRSALALGSAATASVGDFDPAGVAAAVSTALAAETSRATAAEATAAQKSANLSDLASASSARTNLGLGSAATQPSTAFDAAGAAAAAQAASQPLDSDLTAIAALATTAFGRALLALADAAAGRTALGLGSAAVAATTDFDAAGAAAAAQAVAVQRANHTGTQPASTISDFTEAAQDAVGAAATDSATLDLTYDDAAGTISGAVLDSPKVGGVAVSGTPSAGNVITALSAGAATWSPVPSAPVSSVNGRTGAVTGLAEASALATETSRATAAEALALQKSTNLSDLASAATARTNLGLGSAATQPSSAFDTAGAAAAAQAASQPVDSDLTAIAALSTTTFGRSLLALLDAAAGRTAFGLGSAATQPSSAFDVAGAAAAAQAASLQRASNLADLASAPKARQNLGLVTDPRVYGAIGDGTSRPLSTLYGSLAAAQAAFPTIADLALTDELDWAAIQHCINVVTGPANPVTTVRYVTAPIHVYAGSYICNRKVYVASALGFSFEGDGDSTIFRFLGTLDAGFDFNGISMSYVGKFAVKGKGDLSEDLTRAIWYHWDPATSSRTCYNNHFEDINVYELHYRTCWEVGELGNNGQVDTDLFVRCLAAGSSGPLVADATYWRDGFAVGDGVFANNLLHTFIGCMTYGHHRGLAVRGTQVKWEGGQIQNNEIDIYTAVVSYCVVQGFRSEGSARLLETAGPAGYATHVSIRDVQWIPNELNSDTHFAIISTAGTVLFEQVNIAPWPSKTPTISAGQIGKLVIQFNGVSATTAPEALAGSWSAGAMLALRPYLQLDADGIPIQLVEQSEPDTLWFADASQANRENGLHRTPAGDVGALQGLTASTAGPGGGVRMFDDGAGHLSPNGGSARPLFVDGWQMVILPRAVFYDFVDLVEFTTANMHFNDAAGHLRLGITTGSVEVAGTDLDVSTSGKGTILKSPAGNRFRVTVDDDGVIDTVAL